MWMLLLLSSAQVHFKSAASEFLISQAKTTQPGSDIHKAFVVMVRIKQKWKKSLWNLEPLGLGNS